MTMTTTKTIRPSTSTLQTTRRTPLPRQRSPHPPSNRQLHIPASKQAYTEAETESFCQKHKLKAGTYRARATVLDEVLIRRHQARYIVSIMDDATTTTTHCPSQRAVDAMTIASSDATTIAGDDDDDNNDNDDARPVTIGICFVDVTQGGIKLLEEARFNPVPESELTAYLSNKNQSESHHAALRRLHAYTTSYAVCSHAFGAMVIQLQSLRIDKEVLSLGSYSLIPEPDATSEPSRTT